MISLVNTFNLFIIIIIYILNIVEPLFNGHPGTEWGGSCREVIILSKVFGSAHSRDKKNLAIMRYVTVLERWPWFIAYGLENCPIYFNHFTMYVHSNQVLVHWTSILLWDAFLNTTIIDASGRNNISLNKINIICWVKNLFIGCMTFWLTVSQKYVTHNGWILVLLILISLRSFCPWKTFWITFCMDHGLEKVWDFVQAASFYFGHVIIKFYFH